ncbi:MAG: hypothetical protein ACLTE2_09900 [Eubacteriales bacterium]
MAVYNRMIRAAGFEVQTLRLRYWDLLVPTGAENNRIPTVCGTRLHHSGL